MREISGASFKDWLAMQELSTSTSCVAHVPMRWGPGPEELISRMFPDKVVLNDDDHHKKHKKKHKKHH